MQAIRLPLRRASRINKIAKAPIHTTATNMSLFPRFQEFTPLFRFMDEYERAARQDFGPSLQKLRAFQPKFDVKEVQDSYELHGELPGIEQKDISIEWTDGNTITISGRTEQRSERGQPPQGLIEGEVSEKPKQPTVEDEAETTSNGNTTVTKTSDNKEVAQPTEQGKYWVTERSVGEFHRSFSFPTRVDQDAVKASLKNGILSIVVPKAKAPQPRKINIE